MRSPMPQRGWVPPEGRMQVLKSVIPVLVLAACQMPEAKIYSSIEAATASDVLNP